MARMIPDFIDQDDPRLSAERKVFRWLEDSQVEGIVLHSLKLKNHSRKSIGELDFLLINSNGFLAIEVKGGRISRKEGSWYTTDRFGETKRLKESPFNQARTGMYALREYISAVCTEKSQLPKALFGYCVILPDCVYGGEDPEIVSEVLFDASTAEKTEFHKFLTDSMLFWNDEAYNKNGYKRHPLSPSGIESAVNLLRGNLSLAPSMNTAVGQIERYLEKLTEEQYDVLENTVFNPQLMVFGVAGTGKTLLALEKCRREIAAGHSVLYLCYNRHMALVADEALRATVRAENNTRYRAVNIDKLLYDSIVKHMGNTSLVDDEFHPNKLAEVFLSISPATDKYDSIVIDEGQDLMKERFWECIGHFHSEGLEEGSWVLFLDPNQNIFVANEDYAFLVEYITKTIKPAILSLTHNCRNTRQISEQVSFLTTVHPAKHMKAGGPEVVMIPYGSKAEFRKSLLKEVNNLVSSGIRPESIVILSKYKLDNSILSGIELPGHRIDGTGKYFSNPVPHSIRYFTVQSFKGLEASVILMIDVNSFSDDTSKALNYVGLSRAKTILRVFYDECARDDLMRVAMASKDIF